MKVPSVAATFHLPGFGQLCNCNKSREPPPQVSLKAIGKPNWVTFHTLKGWNVINRWFLGDHVCRFLLPMSELIIQFSVALMWNLSVENHPSWISNNTWGIYSAPMPSLPRPISRSCTFPLLITASIASSCVLLESYYYVLLLLFCVFFVLPSAKETIEHWSLKFKSSKTANLCPHCWLTRTQHKHMA